MLDSLPLAQIYQFIEPGPVLLLTTALPGHKPNVMALSWHMMLEFEPPLIACVVGQANHSFGALRQSGSCVLAIPPASLAQTVVSVGNCSGKDTDKFGVYNLTPLPAKHVAAPLIGEAIVNLECRVKDTRAVTSYNMFVLECVGAWQNKRLLHEPTLHHKGYGRFGILSEEITLKSRMR
jgi:flavin reductase (DIM6/NTAB) family NADH-FMN oxidoreductase RutF